MVHFSLGSHDIGVQFESNRQYDEHALLGGPFISTVRKTIILNGKQDEWIKTQIVVGSYTNDSEYMHNMIQREQECSAEMETVRTALAEGEQSGEPKPFDAAAFKEKMTASHG